MDRESSERETIGEYILKIWFPSRGNFILSGSELPLKNVEMVVFLSHKN